MALFNLVKNVVFFLLFLPTTLLVALPLATFAGATTILAWFILLGRLCLAYVEVGLETLHYVYQGRSRFIESPSVSRRSSQPSSPIDSRSHSPRSGSPQSIRNRRRNVSFVTINRKSQYGFDGLAVPSGPGLDRDYEGLGGPRLGDSLNAADEHAWESINSRFEMPNPHRNHFRSHSGGAVLAMGNGAAPYMKVGLRTGPLSPVEPRIATAWSPNSSRSRTPTRNKMEPFTNVEQEGSYFPIITSHEFRKIAV
ncbi:hypothetical protein BX600DRAFT_429276 [Xylariales sp. PMI_506]|nr:hypothetical protein BX600DRAFT_429276 [Xylariales sp. PMI_506]